MRTKTNQKNLSLLLVMFFFLLGCTNTPENQKQLLISVTNTSFPKPTESIEEITPTITPSISREESKCASIQVENKIPEPNLPENYIGKTFDTLELPSGLEFVSGSLIDDSNFTLTQVITLENDAHLLWLSEIQCRQDYIQDVLVLPVLKDNEELVIRYCRINGQEDPEILAIGEFTSGTIPLTTIEYAWRANRETKRFEVLSSDGIECWRDIGINSP